MHKTPALLRRWAAQFPGTQYPTSAADLSVEQRMHLDQNDPELGQIVSGTAPVELELQVMDGSFADFIPSKAEREQAANAAEVQELLKTAFPTQGYYTSDGEYVPGQEGNITEQLRIAALDPAAYHRAQLQANPPKADPHAMTAEQRQFVQEQMAMQSEARLTSLQTAGDFGYGE